MLQIGAVSRKDAYDFSSKSIVELFSPPRVTEYARRHRLGDGVAMESGGLVMSTGGHGILALKNAGHVQVI